MQGYNPRLLPSRATLAWGCSWDLRLWFAVSNPDPVPVLIKTPAMIAEEDIRGDFPKVRMPKVIRSDKGPAFVS